jgi:hypothetical protein
MTEKRPGIGRGEIPTEMAPDTQRSPESEIDSIRRTVIVAADNLARAVRSFDTKAINTAIDLYFEARFRLTQVEGDR